MDKKLLILTAGLLVGSYQTLRAASLPALDSAGCLEEVQQVCQGSRQEIAVCLETQGARISQTCRNQYWEAQAMIHDNEGVGGCAADLQSLCPATSVRAIQKCLKRELHRLPPACLTTLASLPPL